MGNKSNDPVINFRKNVKYKKEYDVYTLQLKHPCRPWWLLLLLLPLLLLVKCNKDITVTCVESETGVPVAGQPVALTYDAHFLWNDGHFMDTQAVARTQVTDADGKTVFEDLPCSVYSYIFHCRSKVVLTAESDCYAAVGEIRNFHYTRRTTLVMKPRREDFHIKIVDDDTGDILPDARIVYRYFEHETERIDSSYADVAGIATLPNMRYCSVIDQITGSCYGYADTTAVQVSGRSILNPSDSTALRLRPIKQSFSFFVKNKQTRQPIPDAICTVTLTHPGASRTVDRRQVRTSIDGKGKAVYDDAFILSTVEITASKEHFNDGALEGGPWTVEKFANQPDSLRTIWLEPAPYLVEFINVDSLTSRRIPGVKNVIKITDPAGNVETVTEISNSNGVFPVSAKEGSRIEIISTKAPAYKQKNTLIRSFEHGEVIRMKAERVVYENSSSQKGRSQKCYDMKEGPCEFQFDWSLCDACTMLTVSDGNGQVIARFGRNDPAGGGGGIKYSDSSGSRRLRSSTQKICVTMNNVNGHDCTYRIDKK